MRRAAEAGPTWSGHDTAWREPAQVIAGWEGADSVDPGLLQYKVRGPWWEILAGSGITLFITREYEHLVIALSAGDSGPSVSYLRVPHPSGFVVDRERSVAHLASTRNPNQVYDLVPVTGLLDRSNIRRQPLERNPLVPVRARFLPGALYLHDLGLIGGQLHANAVGENAVVRLHDDGRHERVWWPRCIEVDHAPVFARNHLQLNSIAAGDDLEGSFFSASSTTISSRRPGHRDFPVDRRGVVFSGATREPAIVGLTRPHSARLHAGRLWVDDSGYGVFGYGEGGRLECVASLPGWTRGLCFKENIAFVGTSMVIPRFRHYAPGLSPDACVCGVHAVDIRSGAVLGSLEWPAGNQVFAVEWAPLSMTSGFPTQATGRRGRVLARDIFYGFTTPVQQAAPAGGE